MAKANDIEKITFMGFSFYARVLEVSNNHTYYKYLDSNELDTYLKSKK